MSPSTGIGKTPVEGRLRQALRLGWPVLWGANIAPMAWDDAHRGDFGGWVAAVLLLGATVTIMVATALSTRRLHSGERTATPGLVACLLPCVLVAFLVWHLTGDAGQLALVPFTAVAVALIFAPVVAVPVNLVLTAMTFFVDSPHAGWTQAHGMALGTLAATVGTGFGRVAAVRGRQAKLMTEHAQQLQIAEERNRMARDLHDILGHSLTVVAMKAELAEMLVDADPAHAKAELREVQSITRAALADVRATVNNYRELSLAGEIARVASALKSAGVRAELPTVVDEVDPRLRELFAWTLREGVTNVVRHADARRCRVLLAPTSITIEDDGRGVSGSSDGHGLDGLRQRASLAGAVVHTGPASPDSHNPGFRLMVSSEEGER